MGVSTASNSGAWNLAIRTYVGQPYAADVERAIDSVVANYFAGHGLTFAKGNSRLVNANDPTRGTRLELPYVVSAPRSYQNAGAQQELLDAVRAMFATLPAVSYAYLNPSHTRLMAPAGGVTDVNMWPATESEPTTIHSQDVGASTPYVQGRKQQAPALEPVYDAAPAPSGSFLQNNALLIALILGGGLLAVALSDDKPKRRRARA